MFKSSKSKGEKSKFKGIFKLQFKATQVPQVKSKKLSISVVPADIGKPTVRLEKAPIVDGICIWKNPIYETVKFIRDTKTGEFSEKCYHFIVSSGSSKSGLLGQVSINFADYAEGVKSITEPLPLIAFNDGAITETILHVTIENTQNSVDERVSETKSQEGSFNNRQANDNKNENVVEGAFPEKRRVYQRSETDWSLGSGSDESLVDSPESPGGKPQTAMSSSVSGRPADTLEKKLSFLERQAELSELELQTLRKQIAKETKKGQDFSKQITTLKEEKEALEFECKQLKSSKIRDVSDVVAGSDLEAKLEEIMKKLDREKGFNNILRDRVRKAEDSNSEMVFKVRDLNKTLKSKNNEIEDLRSIKKAEKSEKEASRVIIDPEEMEFLKKKIEDLYAEIETLKRENENLYVKFEENEIEKQNMQNECSEYLATIEDFRIQTKKLRQENKKKALEIQEYSSIILDLENQVKDLEKELDELARGYENDLEEVTLGKIKEEKRAIKAEEEFKRVSLEISNKFDESEKLAKKATFEADDLRDQKHNLEEMLQKANEEIRLVTERYEIKIREVLDKKDTKSKEDVKLLQNEMEKLKAGYNDLKKSSSEVEIEREKLKNEVSKLKGDVRNKQEKIMIIEEKLKISSERANNLETKGIVSKRNNFSSDKKRGLVQDSPRDEKMESRTAPNKSEMQTLSENYTKLLSEMETLKEKNKQMEGELKDMEERYSEISLKFAEVEGERQQLVMTVRNLKNAKK